MPGFRFLGGSELGFWGRGGGQVLDFRVGLCWGLEVEGGVSAMSVCRMVKRPFQRGRFGGVSYRGSDFLDLFDFLWDSVS